MKARPTAKIARATLVVPTDTLVVLDPERRLYVGLSSGQSYYHVIRPRRAEDYSARAEGRPIGELACDCVGATTHGSCYQLKAAIRLEAEAALATAPRWMRRAVAPETELERAGARG